MDKKLSDKLFDEFPWMQPTNGYGLAVGDGWYKLLRAIGSYVKNAVEFENECIKRYRKKPEGFTWKPRDTLFAFPIVHQIKEKFGGLRFYCTLDTKQLRYEVQGFIDGMEHISFTICELCGNDGKSRKNGWTVTLCNKCFLIRAKNQKRFPGLRALEAKNEIAREEAL